MKLGFSRIAMRHLLAIVAVSIAFSVAATTYQVYSQFARGREARDEVLQTVRRSYLRPLAAGLFFFDERQLELLTEGVVLLPYVDAVSVMEYRGDERVEVASDGADETENGARHVYPLVHEYEGSRREIGELRVVTSLEELRQELAEQAVLMAVANLLSILGFAVVVLIVAQRMIFRHLKTIAGFLDNLDPKHDSRRKLGLSRAERLDRPDELDEITEAINAMLHRLDNTLTERDTLVQELYHRTNNTMQSVRSILNLQSAKDRGNERFQELVRDVDNRILAMAMVHQKLYQSQSLSRIGMRDYLRELAHETHRSFGPQAERVRLTVEVDEIALLIDSAIPCGIIVTELLSNAVRHAFPGNREGTVDVALRRVEPYRYRLTVTDDGVGMSEDLDHLRGDTIGLPSVVEIAQKQLGGEVSCTGTDGVSWSIVFADDLYFERVSHE